jgi:CMP-N,N'-diacetyllegionaminic acid synthase
MKILAIIPARGGSKGLPGKNIKDLHGKPLIAYTIEVAKQSKHISEIHVSSDDNEILAVAEKYGVITKFIRPSELATDSSLAIETYIFCLNKYQNDFNKKFDVVVILQPTSPLRKIEDVDSCIEMFINKSADSIISYTEESHPVLWHKYIDKQGVITNVFNEGNDVKNRQELKKTYYPNGSVYVFKSSLIQSRRYFSEKTYAYVMPRSRSVDIDAIEDFEYVEFLLSKKNDR